MVAYLTKREKEVLDYIKDFYTHHGFAPSLDEIRIGLGLSSAIPHLCHPFQVYQLR